MLPFFHPTSTLIIDDDARFLESFRFRFDDAFPCQVTTSQEEVVRRLIEQDRARSQFNWMTPPRAPLQGHDTDHQVGGYGYPADFLTATTQERRFAQISVVIVDYDMPAMNGVQLCRAIAEFPVKKILLTGKAAETTAIQAFNEGVIDYFLKKEDEASDADLLRKVPAFASDYFVELTRPISSRLEQSEFGFLFDPEFGERFNEVLQNVDAEEYYLSALPHGVVVLNRAGVPSVLLIADEDTMRAHVEIAAAQNAPEELLTLMSSGTMIPWFPTPQGYYDEAYAANWSDFVYPLLHRKIGNGWSTSFVRGQRAEELLPSQVVSFDAFLQSESDTSPTSQ